VFWAIITVHNINVYCQNRNYLTLLHGTAWCHGDLSILFVTDDNYFEQLQALYVFREWTAGTGVLSLRSRRHYDECNIVMSG
jgi:hypothetical protein